jgi:phage FluMu protein Com
MPIEFRCTQCQRLLRTPDESVGHPARCPQCGLVQTVPAPSSPASAAPEMPVESPFEASPAVDSGNPYQAPGAGTGGPFPGTYGGYDAYLQYALNRVSTPATLLMVLSVLGILGSICGALGSLPGMGLHQLRGGFHVNATVNIVQQSVALAVCIVMFLGAQKMKNLQNYGMSLTASILALLPVSCCCLFLLPVGIWSIVVLNDPYVKAAFRP